MYGKCHSNYPSLSAQNAEVNICTILCLLDPYISSFAPLLFITPARWLNIHFCFVAATLSESGCLPPKPSLAWLRTPNYLLVLQLTRSLVNFLFCPPTYALCELGLGFLMPVVHATHFFTQITELARQLPQIGSKATFVWQSGIPVNSSKTRSHRLANTSPPPLMNCDNYGQSRGLSPGERLCSVCDDCKSPIGKTASHVA